MAEEKQTSLKPLTIYFYHTRLTRESYEGYIPSCTSAGTSQAA